MPVTADPGTTPPPGAHRHRLTRLGTWLGLHPRTVLGLWGLLLLLALTGVGRFTSQLGASDSGVSGSDSQAAAALVRAGFPEAADETDLVVLHSSGLTTDDPAFRARVDAARARLAATPGLTAVGDPYAQPATSVSADRHTALVRVGVPGGDAETRTAAGRLAAVAAGLSDERVEVLATGRSPLAAAAVDQGNRDLARAERIGLPVAAAVLLVAFGSVVAAALPLTLGVLAVLMTFGLLGAVSEVVVFDTFVRSAVTMIGLALGIDYCLFIVSRFREELARAGSAGRPERAAAAGAVLATAGHAVLYSGTTVIVSLSGLLLVRDDGVRATGLGMMVTVAVLVALATTLLPAVLALLGPAVNRLALPWLGRSLAGPDDQRSRWGRLASVSMRRPVLVSVAIAIVLGLLALPGLGLRFGADTSAGAVRDSTAGRGWERLSAAFAPGLIAPLEVVVSRPGERLSADDREAVARVAARAAREVGTVSVSAARTDATGRTALLTVLPADAPDTAAGQELVLRLRAGLDRELAGTGLVAHVGGAAAELGDMIEENDRATPLVIAAVLAASGVLLLGAFRSLLLPLKAIAMNLLSVGAAFGAMVLVFQDGYGAGWLGAQRTGFIQVMIPLIAFALVFGLSMDYEVFMLSRMREAWLRTGDNTAAVRTGLVRTAPVITAAAAIMVVVFASFMVTRVTDLQQLGFTLALAVLIDATLVRLLLVPALMRLMGRWNWWLPGRRPAAGRPA